MAGKASRPSDMLQRLASKPAPIERSGSEADEAGPPAGESRTTRLSVDLDDQHFEFLTIFAMRQKVSKVDVMRTLVAELQESKDLAERVSGRLPKRKRK